MSIAGIFAIIILIAGIVISIMIKASSIGAFLLNILNYFSDKPKIKVTLQWDMEPFGHLTKTYDINKPWGLITVTNVGRRPIFVSHAHLNVSRKENLIIEEGIAGKTLKEGDPPIVLIVTQDGLEKYADKWDKIRAGIIDSSNKIYYSNSVKIKPSWAEKSSNAIGDEANSTQR